MANTFKVITKAGVTSADVIYTVAGSTTTVVLGLIIGNTTSSSINATITPHHLASNRNDMLVGGIRPHLYCLPVLKRRNHQED